MCDVNAVTWLENRLRDFQIFFIRLKQSTPGSVLHVAIFYKLFQLVPSFGGQTTSTCWWDSCGVYWSLCQVANDGDKDKTLF